MMSILSVVLGVLSVVQGTQQKGQARFQDVEPAPAWVSSSQSPKGSWAGDEQVGEVGTTALVLLSLLGDGNSTTQGPYQVAVVRGFDWLVKQMDPRTNLLGVATLGQPPLLEHIWATLALSELACLDPDSKRHLPVQRLALDALLRRQQPDGSFGAARSTGWSVYALVSAQESGGQVPSEVLLRARKALVAQAPILDKPTIESSAALALRVLTGFMLPGPPPASERSQEEARAALAALLMQDNLWTKLNPEQRLLIAFAAYQAGGKTWSMALRGLQATVLEQQILRPGQDRGGFPAEGSFGPMRASALGVLTMEVYFRYARIPRAR